MNSLKEKLSTIGNSPVQNLVEKATSEYLLGADTNLNNEICTAINQGDASVAKDAVKTTRKKLKSKNPKVILLALSLAETMVKHCSSTLHLQIGSPDFMEQMMKLVDRTGDTKDLHVYDKTLELIQLWGEVFRTRRQTFPLFSETYDNLKAAGHRFPPLGDETIARYLQEIDDNQQARIQAQTARVAAASGHHHPQMRQGAPMMAPVVYGQPGAQMRPGMPPQQQQQGHPRAAAPSQQQQQFAHQQQQQQLQQQQQQQQHASSRSHRRPEDATEKLKKDLDVVRQTTQLLSQMIAAHTPGEDPKQNDIMVELVGTCREMAPRLITLITEDSGRLPTNMVESLLELNDDVQRCLDNFEKLCRGEAVDADTLAMQLAEEGLQEQRRIENLSNSVDLLGLDAITGPATTTTAAAPVMLSPPPASAQAQHHHTTTAPAPASSQAVDLLGLGFDTGSGTHASSATAAPAANDFDFDAIARRTSAGSDARTSPAGPQGTANNANIGVNPFSLQTLPPIGSNQNGQQNTRVQANPFLPPINHQNVAPNPFMYNNSTTTNTTAPAAAAAATTAPAPKPAAAPAAGSPPAAVPASPADDDPFSALASRGTPAATAGSGAAGSISLDDFDNFLNSRT